MNVYCDKDGNLMVQNEEYYTCLKCECRIRLEFMPEGSDCADGVCESFRVDGAKTYNDI